MKLFRIACLVAVSFAFLRNVSGQSFVNLNFEQSIVVSSNYDSEFGIYIGTANVLGWTGYLGANKETAILYNNFTLGNAGIDVVGQGVGAIEGQFTLVLQPGFDPFGSGQMLMLLCLKREECHSMLNLYNSKLQSLAVFR
jgi:hypothetical protein